MELRDSDCINNHNELDLTDLMESIYAKTLYKSQFAKLTGMRAGRIPLGSSNECSSNQLVPRVWAFCFVVIVLENE